MRSIYYVMTFVLSLTAIEITAAAADELSEAITIAESHLAFEEPENFFTASETANAWCGHENCCCEDHCSREHGLFFGSDRGFDRFIEPITNPVFFEDPRAMTRVRLVFINQMIPEDNPVLRGGDLQLYGAQVSVALSERFALIALKDGFITLQPDAGTNEDGWGDVGAGFKYVFIRDTCNQFILSGGLMYEWANGSAEVFQGNGDGMWNFFLTAGKEFGNGNQHFVGTIGWHLPNHGEEETESLFYSLHLDHRVNCHLYAVWELNGIEYVDSGSRLPGVNFEGGDLINLGAADVDGNHFISTAFGFTWLLNENTHVSAAYEFPLTEREGLMDNRTTLSLSMFF